MLSLRPNMWLREGGVSAHCEAGRRLFCCGPLRGEDILDRFGVYFGQCNLYIFLILSIAWIKRDTPYVRHASAAVTVCMGLGRHGTWHTWHMMRNSGCRGHAHVRGPGKSTKNNRIGVINYQPFSLSDG